jgi:hypothetical protein
MQYLQLQIPETVFDRLKQVANQEHQPLETVAVRWLTQAATEVDPLDSLIGSIVAEPFDVAEKHDHYLGQNAIRILE